MSSDDSDKTVFKQPSVDSDRTVIRPMPGGRNTKLSQTQPPPVQPQQPVPSPPQAPQQAQQQYSQAGAGSSSAYFTTSSGLNPLVNAASTLIAVFQKTRQRYLIRMSVVYTNV